VAPLVAPGLAVSAFVVQLVFLITGHIHNTQPAWLIYGEQSMGIVAFALIGMIAFRRARGLPPWEPTLHWGKHRRSAG
jgi:hypothetical protein